jgi:excisionase family DNA binding protein
MNTSESTVQEIECFDQSGSSPPSPSDNHRVHPKFKWHPSAHRHGSVGLKPCNVVQAFPVGDSEPFLQVREAAHLAGVHEETVRRAYRTRQLSAQRVGVRSIRIHPLDLRNWMAEGMPTRPKAYQYRQPTLGGG